MVYYYGEVCSLWGSILPKIRITSKKASNKNCSKLNFAQKSPRAHMSISPTSGTRGHQRSVCLKSYNVQKREIRFTLELNAAKNTHFRKNASNKSCSESNFVQKSPRAHMSISPTSGARGLQRSVCLKSYNVQEWKIRFTLHSTLPKIHILGKKLRIKVVQNRISCKSPQAHMSLNHEWS